MKQIFDWLREQIGNRTDGFNSIAMIDVNRVHDIIDEAESKWEAECCEWTELIEYKQRVYANCRFTNDSLDAMSIGYFKFCPYCGKPIKISEVE